MFYSCTLVVYKMWNKKQKKNGLDYSVFIVDMISSQCFAFDNI